MVSNWFINRAKEKRWRAFALALGLCLFSGAAMVTPLGSSAVTAMQQAADDLEDYLNRSPGERGAVLAGKGKGGGKGMALASASAPEGPTEEALGKVFDIPATDPVEEIAGTEAPAAPVGPPLAEAPTVLAPGGFIPVGGGGFPGGGGGGGIPGGGIPGGGGGGGTGGGGGGGGTPPPPGAVPEPSTWALLIMGFMFTGGMMRRANRAARKPVHA